MKHKFNLTDDFIEIMKLFDPATCKQLLASWVLTEVNGTERNPDFYSCFICGASTINGKTFISFPQNEIVIGFLVKEYGIVTANSYQVCRSCFNANGKHKVNSLVLKKEKKEEIEILRAIQLKNKRDRS